MRRILSSHFLQSARTADRRSGADLFMDRSGETAGVHEPVSRFLVATRRPNRGPGVRWSGLIGEADGPGRCHSRMQLVVLRGGVDQMPSPLVFRAAKRRARGVVNGASTHLFTIGTFSRSLGDCLEWMRG